MSIFLSNPKLVAELSNFKILRNESITEDVTLVKSDESCYCSDPFDTPTIEQFKIYIEGWDSNSNPIFREFTIETEDGFGFEPIPVDTFEYGFSLGVPTDKNEASDQPINGKLDDRKVAFYKTQKFQVQKM